MLRKHLWISCFVFLMACRPAADNSKVKTLSGTEDVVQTKNETFLNLVDLMTSGRFLFGQQRATLSGIGLNGMNPWGDNSYGTEPDSQKLVGDQPAVLGMDVWDFAMKNPSWNQPAYAKAARDFYDNGKGGLVAFEWHMRACDIADVVDAEGNRGVPGNGFKIDDWNNDSNRSCLCRIVNEEPWINGMTWKDWLFTQKLDRFATRLQSEGLDLIPMIFRPFHEMNGSWFWWGAKSWDCKKHLGRDNVVTGAEAYKKLFRMTVDYLHVNRSLRNMMIAFSPDKLCKHEGHSCDMTRAQNDSSTDQDLHNDFMSLYPGSSYVDILGLDLYYAVNNGQPWETPEYQSAVFARYLKTVSLIAKEEGKVAALTETGNYNLHNEVTKSSDWFSKHLLPLLTSDKDVQLAFALTWENRASNLTEYYIPYQGHAGYTDFRNFVSNAKTMLLRDAGGLFTPNLLPAKVPGTVGGGREIAVPEASTVLCESSASDPDGDGWGWEHNKSCQVIICASSASDPDGDGWGWENNKSCRVKSMAPVAVTFCQDGKSDPDGDGWGWENNRSCELAKCSSRSVDPDGDGWGFENGHTCKVK